MKTLSSWSGDPTSRSLHLQQFGVGRCLSLQFSTTPSLGGSVAKISN